MKLLFSKEIHMNKILFNAVLIIILSAFAGNLQGAEQDPSAVSIRPSERFGRGVINIITSPLEIPAQLYIRAAYQDEWRESPFAVVGGFIEGIPMGLIYFPWRLTAGVFDITTLPFSRFNKGIISPEYLSFSTKSLE
jgi:putative exosortase-associated protein (TIGR04073 family)